MLLWAFRDDPSVVKFMAQFVSKVRGESFGIVRAISIETARSNTNFFTLYLFVVCGIASCV